MGNAPKAISDTATKRHAPPRQYLMLARKAAIPRGRAEVRIWTKPEA